jgi:micrococcal nuclease
MRCLWTVFLTLLVTSSVLATELTGPVVSILNGDTLEVLNGHHADRIRLSGIDCPEKGQAYGNNAKHTAQISPS